MADETDISQLAPEVGISGDSTAQLAQVVAETGADGSTAQIAQLAIEAGDSASIVQIAQVTIELGRGPEVVPPADTPVATFTFDEGLGNDWFICLQLSDFGDELRDHVVKSFRVTGKVQNARAQVYGYGPLEDIVTEDLEDGANSDTGVIILPDTTQIQQTKRFPTNVKGAKVSTLRLDGRWDGTGIRDQVHEIVMEGASQGRRR